MAQRDIFDILATQEITSLDAADVIHAGRDAEPVAADKDKAITALNLFNQMNGHAALFGAPTGPASLNNTAAQITGFPNSAGVVATIIGNSSFDLLLSGTYRANVTVEFIFASKGFNVATNLVVGVAQYGLAALYLPTQSDGLLTLSASAMFLGTAGENVSIELEIDGNSNISYNNALFEIVPVTLG